MFGGVAVMLAVVIGVPFFRHVMALAWPDASVLTWTVAMLLATMAWLEGWRQFARRVRAWRTAPA
jgi:Ca2+-transporting ATPase